MRCNTPCLKTLPEFCMVAAQNDNEVDPPLRKRFARVPVEYQAAFSRLRFEPVEKLLRATFSAQVRRDFYAQTRGTHLVLVDDIGIPLVVVALVQLVRLDELADVHMAYLDGRAGRRDELGGRAFARSRRASDDNIGGSSRHVGDS